MPDRLWEFHAAGGNTTIALPLPNSYTMPKNGSSSKSGSHVRRQVVMHMSMFQDPRDEDRLCQVLKAYVEERPRECDRLSAATLE